METKFIKAQSAEAAEKALIDKLFDKTKFKAKRIKIDAENGKRIQTAALRRYGGGFGDELA